jgi:hypothetical protein
MPDAVSTEPGLKPLLKIAVAGSTHTSNSAPFLAEATEPDARIAAAAKRIALFISTSLSNYGYRRSRVGMHAVCPYTRIG